MSRITHTEIMITKNPMLKVPVVVPQWEAHVLLALWGEDAQVTGTQVVDRVIPETGDEFTRLANKYGPRDEDIPFVARVYGSFGPGLRGLAKEFEASLASSRVESVVGPDNAEPLEIDRRAFAEADAKKAAAPAILAGFDGSQAPAKPVDLVDGVKVAITETVDAIAKVSIPAAEVNINAPVAQVVIPTAKVALDAPRPDLVAAAIAAAAPKVEGADELKIVEPGTEILTDEQLDAVDVDTFAGNKIDGQQVETFLKSDVSDLTGGDETDA